MKQKRLKPARARASKKIPPSAAPPTPKPVEIAVTPAKGRPMLHWVGKRPLSRVRFFPAQHIETFETAGAPAGGDDAWREWPSVYPKGGLLFHGDNKEVLGHLLVSGFRGKVNLVYIDPPFDSGANYVRRVSLRGPKGTAKIEGETYTLGEQIQYTDIWANDNYLQFMYERLMLLKELLRPSGIIYLHSDHRKEHHLRLLLDEVLGPDNYLNTISWRSQTPRGAKVAAFYYPFSTHYIHIYAKDRTAPPTWHPQRKEIVISAEEVERDYYKDEKGYFRTSDPGTYSFKALLRLYREGRIYVTKDGKVVVDEKTKTFRTTKGTIGIKYYLKPNGKGCYIAERTIDNLWEDIPGLGTTPGEDTGYPTQKTKAFLARIIRASSDLGDLVLDCFIGSGTTATVAQRLGRRWIGADINKGAIQTTSKRLQTIIKEQIEASGGTERLPGMEEKDAPPAPAQSSFTVWRVNDYDLTIQHNEAVNLTCEKIGVERKRTDAFFDGTLGKALVKIVPFGHPLTPLDLEEIKRELEARPDEDRPVTVVALGVEIAARAWVDEWNRLRKGKNAVNRIEVIDLRTDPKHGGFLLHKPAQAKVKIARKKDKISIEIEDFVSPMIIERLRDQAGILKPKIDDWRSMVDCVMVDPAYDGRIFKVVLSDVPERKTDLVVGKYEISAPDGETTVAIKIIDMLGEEVLVTQKVGSIK